MGINHHITNEKAGHACIDVENSGIHKSGNWRAERLVTAYRLNSSYRAEQPK